jgi:hypothetical protein
VSETSSAKPLFRFSQVEYPWTFGPPDGRYLLRRPADGPDAQPAHVLVLATLGAPERRRRLAKRKRQAEPEPEPSLVTTGRATIIEVGEPFTTEAQASGWLRNAGESDLAAGIAVLNWTLYSFRLVTADPYLHPVGREHALVARIGFGAGEQVADGLWTDARELLSDPGRQPRSKVLHPQARLAAVLGGRERAMACEELALRARLDLDYNRDREAALQVLVALDAALAEFQTDPAFANLSDRLDELRAQRKAIAAAAQTALAGPLVDHQREDVAFTLGRIEAALRARAVVNA